MQITNILFANSIRKVFEILEHLLYLLNFLICKVFFLDKRETFKCNHCQTEFDDLDDLITHQDEKHPDMLISYTDPSNDGNVTHCIQPYKHTTL